MESPIPAGDGLGRRVFVLNVDGSIWSVGDTIMVGASSRSHRSLLWGLGVFTPTPSNVMFGNPRIRGLPQQIMRFETRSRNASMRNTPHCIFSKQAD